MEKVPTHPMQAGFSENTVSHVLALLHLFSVEILKMRIVSEIKYNC